MDNFNKLLDLMKTFLETKSNLDIIEKNIEKSLLNFSQDEMLVLDKLSLILSTNINLHQRQILDIILRGYEVKKDYTLKKMQQADKIIKEMKKDAEENNEGTTEF